jgi:GNAT superfamily N-acetyltransferase
MIEREDLELRPVRTSDRQAVAGLAAPGERIPFDEWAESPGGLFWAGELLGRVVGVARTSLVAPAIFHVDGLLVDREQRRQGIGAALLTNVVDLLRAQGGRGLRAEALDPATRGLAVRCGFRIVAQAFPWRASRVEGGEPARLATERDLPVLVQLAAGRLLAPGEGRDLDQGTLRERVEAGAVRVAPGGRAYAVVVAEEPRLVVAALAGRSVLWPQLVEELRFEADLHDLAGVDVWLAASEEGGGQVLEGAGYHRDDATRLDALELDL